ncbi:L,D-transpeptidase family protein [Denitrobaculum tricleocarpae]|uniref:L,D-transpeptidase family protein n=2 Tax=Denitrobaculum tricleocarpae TaxID=2591009 RepID=A0A545TRX8_9PROT|nr:L,D-transpeptidase family protein [Denitrobaculum tricleocarpae]
MDLLVEQTAEGWRARFGHRECRCAVGRSNLISAERKQEGDGATPVGRWRMLRVLYRPDRIQDVQTALPLSAITTNDGWCDAPEDPNYNRQVTLPFEASHEKLWREDQLYDALVVLNHNSDPIVPGRGSAIFLHVARENFEATEGCVALQQDDLLKILREVDRDSAVVITAPET